jgi:hypothetical protein
VRRTGIRSGSGTEDGRDRPRRRELLARPLRPARDPARDWKTLGPKLAGKIHIYCGTMDNYFLNDAVYLMEDFLKSTTDPPYGG